MDEPAHLAAFGALLRMRDGIDVRLPADAARVAALLRSAVELGVDERAALADLIDPGSNSRGRLEWKMRGPGLKQVRMRRVRQEIMTEIRALQIIQNHPAGMKLEAAIHQAKLETGLSRSELFALLKRARRLRK